MSRIKKSDMAEAKLELINAIIKGQTFSVRLGPIEPGELIKMTVEFAMTPQTMPVIGRAMGNKRA